MKYWKLFFNPPKVKPHEAIQPTDEPRECDVAATASVEALPGTDGDAAQLDPASAAEGEARATARVFLIPIPGARLAAAFKCLHLRGYRMKFRGKHVEMVN